MKIKYCTALLLNVAWLFAQESPVASGNDVSGSGGTVAYSVGQVVYSFQSGANGSVTQGVEQPFEISSILGVGEQQISLEMAAYPNPTFGQLTLTIEDYVGSGLMMQLVDLNGKILQQLEITQANESIAMDKLAQGLYFLKISNQNQPIKIFKIIKK